MLMSISAQHPRYRYYSSAEPLYESCNNNTRERRKALKSRQRENFIDLELLTPHQLQYFMKFSIFQICARRTNDPRIGFKFLHESNWQCTDSKIRLKLQTAIFFKFSKIWWCNIVPNFLRAHGAPSMKFRFSTTKMKHTSNKKDPRRPISRFEPQMIEFSKFRPYLTYLRQPPWIEPPAGMQIFKW